MQPVTVLESHARRQHLVLLLATATAKCGPFQIVSHINVLRCVEDIGHDYEVYSLDSCRPRELDLVEAIEASDEGVRVRQHMIVIVLHDSFKVLEFVMRDSLEHILAIGCVVEERAGLACRAL